MEELLVDRAQSSKLLAVEADVVVVFEFVEVNFSSQDRKDCWSSLSSFVLLVLLLLLLLQDLLMLELPESCELIKLIWFRLPWKESLWCWWW